MTNQRKHRGADKLARHLQSATARERAARQGARSKPPAPIEPAGHVYGYCRVSTARQADEGESLDVQERQIAGYATIHGFAVERVYVERGVSGSKPLAERPEGAQLLAVLRPGDVVITPKLDRMFRSALDALDVLARLRQGGISLHMIDLGGDTTGNGIGKLVFTILSAVAEAERDRTRERVAEMKRDQRQRGRFLGGTVPFGFRVGPDGALVEIPEQQAAIRQIRKLRDQGLALRPIAAAMRASGVSITFMGVKKVLDREDATRPAP
jgi:DNA invertase Pin-like site-specific DNA recombinase